MSEAVLIGPKCGDSEILSAHEYSAVKNLIQLYRLKGSKEASAIVDGIYHCDAAALGSFGKERGLLLYFLKNLMHELGEHADEISAMFTDGWETLMFLREDEDSYQTRCVTALLKILEGESWFAEWLLIFLPAYVREKWSPVEVMWKLSEEATNFESNIEDAKRMLKDWPELVQPAAEAQEVH